MSENSIRILFPYRYHGQWVFDDAAVGLEREPFVAGIDTLIDQVVADIADAAEGFRLLFSAVPFPGHTIMLEWRREDSGGNWDRSERHQTEGWLCPALFKYFEEAPPKLYAQALPTGA